MTFNFCILLPAVILMALRNINMPLLLLIMTFSTYLVLMGYRANREYWSALQNEILLLKRSEELKTLSRIDVLTGLYNRRHFDERFELAWKQATRHGVSLALILCDIDHFKQVNDVHGHLAGDEFLKLTANVLAEVFKRDTDLVARYGGEEFVILLTDTDISTAHAMAEMIRKRMEDMVLSYNHNSINTTLSIGIASTTPAYPTEQDAMLLNADKALYRAKQDGRNRTVAYPGGSPNTPLRASEQGDG
jgi:diguanylate cyclase (GGDEF)-like protein